jgi:hypothetical protein
MGNGFGMGVGKRRVPFSLLLISLSLRSREIK